MKYTFIDNDTFDNKEETKIIPKKFDYIECQNCKTTFCENSKFPALYILSRSDKFVWWHIKCIRDRNYKTYV